MLEVFFVGVSCSFCPNYHILNADLHTLFCQTLTSGVFQELNIFHRVCLETKCHRKLPYDIYRKSSSEITAARNHVMIPVLQTMPSPDGLLSSWQQMTWSFDVLCGTGRVSRCPEKILFEVCPQTTCCEHELALPLY